MADVGNPLAYRTETTTPAPGVHVFQAQGNAVAIETERGVVQIEAGPGRGVTRRMIETVRERTDAQILAICYSHGHLGYNAGAPQWLEHARERGEPPPRLIAHENLVRRYRRYEETARLQQLFVEIQFRVPLGTLTGPLEITYPDETFREALTLAGPGRTVQLLWAPSETDDAIAAWLPEDRILYGGAAVIPSIPNVGTPLRTLRDPVRWADTLERLAALRPRLVIREFGPPLEGEEEAQRVMGLTARALRWLRAEVVARLNRGMTDVEILHDLAYPPELFEQPWMIPIYGCADYIVRDVVRSETGWWDRNPTHLHPASPDAAGAAVLSALADRGAVLDRARELAKAGETQLALHVIDLLALAPGDDLEVVEARRLKAELTRARAEESRSFVSRSLYLSSAELIERAIRGAGIR